VTILYLLLIFIFGFLIYLYFYTQSVKIQEIEVKSNSEYTRSFSGNNKGSNFTILHLSDFHFTREGILEDKLKMKIAELNYDLVALTGDYLEDSGKMADFFRYLDSLNFTAPVVAVAGNHDYNNNFNDLKLRFERRGIKFLHNESIIYYHNSSKINLIGVGSPNRARDDLETALQRRRPDRESFAKFESQRVSFADVKSNQAEKDIDTYNDYIKTENSNIDIENENKETEYDNNYNKSENGENKSKNEEESINIILSHTHEIVNSLDDESDSCSSSGVDLILTGDTHGGQINIPFISRFIIPLAFNRDSNFIAGKYNHGNTVIYINRGLGTTILPFRFNSRPEITLVRLKH